MNKELANQVLNKIKENLSCWKQEMWATKEPCGTSHCFAGHVVHLSFPDAQPIFMVNSSITSQYTLNGQVCTYKNTARELLGLTPREADDLFDANNTLEDLEELINDSHANLH